MQFNDLLVVSRLDPSEVALALHKQATPHDRRVLATLAKEDPSAFNAFQATHASLQEATLVKRPYMASFLQTAAGVFCFLGVYKNRGNRAFGEIRSETLDVFEVMQNHFSGDEQCSRQELLELYAGRKWFDPELLDLMADLRGRLFVADPGARNYMRLAERTVLAVLEIAREERIVPPMPDWDDLCVSAHDLMNLPGEWRIQLAAWRGIYLIVDQADGARYVGSAYGTENLWGRWTEHVAQQTGVTKELSRRRTTGFRFSILQLLSPAAGIDEVTQAERRWMQRLSTIDFGLNT